MVILYEVTAFPKHCFWFSFLFVICTYICDVFHAELLLLQLNLGYSSWTKKIWSYLYLILRSMILQNPPWSCQRLNCSKTDVTYNKAQMYYLVSITRGDIGQFKKYIGLTMLKRSAKAKGTLRLWWSMVMSWSLTDTSNKAFALILFLPFKLFKN